jgi:hypothetical protein
MATPARPFSTHVYMLASPVHPPFPYRQSRGIHCPIRVARRAISQEHHRRLIGKGFLIDVSSLLIRRRKVGWERPSEQHYNTSKHIDE